MKILAVTHYFPLPQDMGGAIRVFGLLRALSEEHELHLIAVRRPETSDAVVAEAEQALDATIDALPPFTDPDRGPGVWLRSIARREPPWILTRRRHEIDARIRELAPSYDALVILDDYVGPHLATAREVAPEIAIVADKPRVLGAAFVDPSGPTLVDRARDRLGAWLSRAYERNYLKHADVTVVTSDEEAERFHGLYGERPEVVVSAIDLPAEVRANGGSRAVGWVGSMDGPPIVEGLRAFAENGWPPLGEDGYELRVVGRAQPPELAALEQIPGVRMMGYVEDLDAFLGELSAAVIPLWGGQGIKLKTLTLLGAGVPVAATPAALEGIAADDGRDCLVADDAQGLSAALRRILSEPELSATLRSGGRQLVREHYTWESAGPQFRELVEAAVRERGSR